MALVAFALAAQSEAGSPRERGQGHARERCRTCRDSEPSSLGADGFAAVTTPVTGGCGAKRAKTYHVANRAQLVAALYGVGSGCRHRPLPPLPDNEPKIIYVSGTIDLNVDDRGVPLREEDYMALCNYTAQATFYDPVTHEQGGSGGFFGAYKAAYDPSAWLRQSLDTDGRPPALSGQLEEARQCFSREQTRRVVVAVGSNTSLIGVPGTNPTIINGMLRLGFLRSQSVPDPANPGATIRVLDANNYFAENVVVRNISFADAFDMFPGWDPKDSFSITVTNTNGCQATFDAATDSGPHRCTARGGRWNSNYDNIVLENVRGVWLDHNSFSDTPRFDKLYPPVFPTPFAEATQKVQHHDGFVDITGGATQVTLSYNVFENHDKAHLVGGSDSVDVVTGYGPGKLDVTFHHNHWLDIVQRMPRVRFGRVHVYNNFYELDWRATADYRLGDAWAAGTAGKLYAESNVFEIQNNSAVPASKIAAYSSSTSNRQRCIDAGFSAADCGTYFFEFGTVVTTVTPTEATTSVLDVFSALQVKQAASSSNAPLIKLDPADGSVYWLPSHSYAYTATPVTSPGDQEALIQSVLLEAGAGNL